VKAGQHPGAYNIVTATIPGADPKLREEEIAFSCHLDHQRPGANDNASGCVTILEVARTLRKLITEGKLARPARTLRFIWPPEIEGTTTLLNARPEFASRIKAVVHMDMVGGGPATKAIFHVTRGPMSLPSFVYDVGEAFGDFVNRESDLYASTGAALYPFVSTEGGKEALQAEFADYTMGSDHDVYQEGSFRIPAVYLNDWPDRYIHTNGDTSANIDPTKLKRAAFIGAASGYFLAGMGAKDVPDVLHLVERRSLVRWGTILSRRAILGIGDWLAQTVVIQKYEHEVVDSLTTFAPIDEPLRNEDSQFAQSRSELLFAPYPNHLVALSILESVNVKNLDSWKIVFIRSANPKGPMAVFGYDYLADHLESMKLARPKLLEYQGLTSAGEEYAYETLNFVDGKRNIADICSAVSTEYGPIPQELVLEYLKTMESIGVLKRLPAPPPK
nr:M28 family peptidase [Candidatus Acidoferrales bacterium]